MIYFLLLIQDPWVFFGTVSHLPCMPPRGIPWRLPLPVGVVGVGRAGTFSLGVGLGPARPLNHLSLAHRETTFHPRVVEKVSVALVVHVRGWDEVGGAGLLYR